MNNKVLDFIEDHGWREFRYGQWDCVMLLLFWLDRHNPDKAQVIQDFMDETGYEFVEDEASYQRYLVKLGAKSLDQYVELFTSRGFEEVDCPSLGDIFINPDKSMGVVLDWGRGMFIQPDGRIVITPARTGARMLSCLR